MPTSCPNCRAAIVSGMRTCQFCGAPLDSAEPAASVSRQAAPPLVQAAPEAPRPAVPATITQPPAQIQKRSNRSLPKPLLYGAAVVIFLIVFVFILFFAFRSLNVFSTPNSGTGSTASETQNPRSPSSGPASASELGIDIYPGAREVDDPDRSSSSDGTVVSATFVSADPMSRVIDFYKARMVGSASIYASGNGVVVSISHNAQDSVEVGISPATSGGKTRISITHTTNKS
jgi:hypothetical protein